MSLSAHETLEIIDEPAFEQAQDLTIELALAERQLIEAANKYLKVYIETRTLVDAVDEYTDTNTNKATDSDLTSPSIQVLLEVFHSACGPNETITDLALNAE